MDIIVSKNHGLDGEGFLVVETLAEAEAVLGRIGCLIYTKSNETSENKIMYLNSMRDRVGKFVYICSEKDTDVMVKMVITGMNGRYFDDEFFVEGKDELRNLLDSLDEVTELAEMGGVSVLGDFLNRYLKNGSSNFSVGYLCVVKEAVQSLVSDYNQKKLEMLQMSETATELFSNTAEVIVAMKKEHGEMEKAVERLKSDINRGVLGGSVGSGERIRREPSLVFFPQVSYMKERRIIRIKEIGSFRYLISFVLGMRLYLENVKNVRPKLIIVEPVGELIEKQYEGFDWVTQARVKDKRYFFNSVVFTNCPNKEVMSTLLDDQDYDTFIVVDRINCSRSHVLNSRGSLYYAVGGAGCIERFKLPVGNCFSSVDPIRGSLFTVKSGSEYPVEKSARERYYMSRFGENFMMLV